MNQSVTPLELELLLIFLASADQQGHVDLNLARQLANGTGILTIPDIPVKLGQRHLNIIMDSGRAPDIRPALKAIASSPLYQRTI